MFKFSIITFIIISFAHGTVITIDRTHYNPIPNQGTAIQELIRKATKYKGNVVTNHQLIERIQKRAELNQTDTLRVLALRVEFTEDSTPLTSGNGKMDLAGFLTPDNGLFYDPPHTRRYFERQLEGMHNYFWLNSMGKLSVNYTVMPRTVAGSYQLPHPMTYYGDTISIEGIETGLCRLMYDAIRQADQDPALHFADYDLIIIFHAGAGAQGEIDYPPDTPFNLLAGTIGPSALEAYIGTPYILADSGRTQIPAATILPEMMRQDTMYYGQTNILGMTGLAGTLCHEFSHLLGAYDLYDVTGNSMGVGAWSLMGYGGWLGDWGAGAPPGVIPGMLDPYHKISLGWIEPLVISMPEESVPIFAAEMDSNHIRFRGDSSAPIIIKVPISQTEYFLIENRQVDVKRKDTIVVHTEDGVLVSIEDGEYDFFLPGSGVLIWHIDENVINEYGPYNAINIFPEHKGVDLEEGDGIQDFDKFNYAFTLDYQIYGSKYDPFFVGGFNYQLSDSTTPNSDGYYGRTHIKLTTLSVPETTMLLTAKFGLNHTGFPKDLGRATKLISPSYADIDQDNRLEIVVSDSGGAVFAFRDDGTPYSGLPSGGFIPRMINSMVASPAIGDVAGDNKLEVICAGEDGKVCVYSYSGSGIIAQMQTSDRFLASPVLVDLDVDGKKEIVIGSTDMNLYIWKGDGTPFPGFPKFLNSEIRAAVAITDTINPQIAVLGSDNRLFLINTNDAMIVNHFPITLTNSSLYTLAPPAIGDVDRDGNKEIIAIANTGNNYRLFVIDFTGKIKYSSSAIIQSPVNSAPALADIDNDGYLDIVIAGKNKIYAFNFNGTLKTNYPFTQDSTYTSTIVAGGYLITVDVPFIFNSSPIICDLNNDSISDIIIGSPRYGILGFNGRTGTLLNYFPLATVGSVSAAPIAFDLDQNNNLAVVVGSDAGILYAWDFPVPAQNLCWNQYLKDACHTGLAALPVIQPGSTNIIVKNFYAYPNPANNEVKVRYWLGSTALNVKINILDMSGNSKYEITNATCIPQIDNEVTVLLNGIPSGLYMLRLEVDANQKKEVKFYKFAIVK